MKNKIKTNFFEIISFVNSEKNYLIFLLLIINNLYAIIALVFPDYNYIDSVLAFFTGNYYILILQLSVLMSVNFTIHQFENNYALIIRFKNRKKYMQELVKRVFRNTIIIQIINIIMALIVINITKGNNIKILTIENYNILNITYAIFYLIRFSTIITLNGLLFLYIIKNGKKNISLIICFLYALLACIISLKNHFYVLYFEYFNVLICDSFLQEIIKSFLFILISVIILTTIHNSTIKYMKKIVN